MTTVDTPPMTPTRPMDGAAYLDSIRDGRQIHINGERVEDVFFITDEDARPITDPERCRAIQDAIRERLEAEGFEVR